MSVAKRIFGVISCLLVYVGTVALDLYNAARYKEEAYLNGGHLYTNWYSVYDIPEVHCIDGYDIFSACFWPMLLILPMFLYFTVRRENLSRWYKILIVVSAILLVDSIIYDEAGIFKDKRAEVKIGNETYFIDTEGRRL